MADYSITVTNSLRVFGIGPSSKWGEATFPVTFTWGTTTWGEGTTPQTIRFEKVVTSTVAPDTIILKESSKLIETSFAVSSNPISEQLLSGIWKIVFVDRTTEAEDRDFATWTASSTTAISFSCAAAGSTIWS